MECSEPPPSAKAPAESAHHARRRPEGLRTRTHKSRHRPDARTANVLSGEHRVVHPPVAAFSRNSCITPGWKVADGRDVACGVADFLVFAHQAGQVGMFGID